MDRFLYVLLAGIGLNGRGGPRTRPCWAQHTTRGPHDPPLLVKPLLVKPLLVQPILVNKRGVSPHARDPALARPLCCTHVPPCCVHVPLLHARPPFGV